MTELPLDKWRDFYVMIGTASGALVGANFVVVTLASTLEQRTFGLKAFITPTAVHLGSVLVGSAFLTVPTLTPVSFALLLGSCGFTGFAYGVVAASRIWHMKLDLEDRFFYVFLPILSYTVMMAAAVLVLIPKSPALELLAASLVWLLVIGMRNSWDMATFMITRQKQG